MPPGPTLAGGPKLVALREVSLAGYLDRQQVVRSSEDYRLTVSESDWWGEPLSGMLTRVLAEALAQRLPRSSVVAADSAIRMTPDATVEIGIQRLDANREGAIVLAAQIAVTFREGRRGSLVRPSPPPCPRMRRTRGPMSPRPASPSAGSRTLPLACCRGHRKVPQFSATGMPALRRAARGWSDCQPGPE